MELSTQIGDFVFSEETVNMIKQLWNDHKIIIIIIAVFCVLVAVAIPVIVLISKQPADDAITGTLSFKYDAKAVTICPLGSYTSSCFTDNVCHADTIDGHWVIEKDDGKGKNFVKLDGNNITILNDYEGMFKIKVSMYRSDKDQYGFVFHLNGIPYATCLFQQLKERFVKTRFCDWEIPQSGQYRLDSVGGQFRLTTLMFNETSTHLNKGDVITISVFGNNAFIVGTPSIYYDGTITY